MERPLNMQSIKLLSAAGDNSALLVLSVAVFAALSWLMIYHLPIYFNRTYKQWHNLRSAITTRARRGSVIGNDSAVEENSPTAGVTKENEFPTNWWTDPKLFALERRAIFSKTWLHVCHSSAFQKAGDYRTFSIANFNFFIVQGKDGKLRAFHNVCRHRAYTVATKEEGSSLVLRCKYHGWSYDTKGKLIKAPKFEDISGFDFSQNGLYEIRTFIDSSGFIYVNFDIYGSDGLTIRVGVPIRAKLRLVESWREEAKFNWKIAIPSGTFRIRSLAMQSKLPELLSSVLGSMESWKWPVEFELSPLTRLLSSRNGKLWLTIAIIPVSSDACTVACSLYTSKLDLQGELPVTAIKAEVNDSIKKLQLIFDEARTSGFIADEKSQEPLLAEIKAHSRLERLMKAEVHPASRLKETSQACQTADDLCRQLEAGQDSKVNIEDMTSLSW